MSRDAPLPIHDVAPPVAPPSGPTPARPPVRPLRRFVLSGPILGALIYVGLFARSLIGFGAGEYMGVEDSGIIDRAIAMFKTEVLTLQAQLLGLYAAVGAVVGTLAYLFLLAVATLRAKPLPGSWRLGLRVLGLVLLVHTGFLLSSMLEYPQVYYDPFFAKGGVWKALQVAVTDYTSPGFYRGLAWFAALGWVSTVAAAVARARAIARFPRRSAALAGVLGVGLGVWVGAATIAPTPPVTKANVLVLAVDSLRPDFISADLTPRLHALSTDAVVFDDAYTVMARTFPSWVSMLTGQYPHTHGVRHMFPSPENLAVRRHTVIDELAARGYRTAVISDFAGDIFSRIELGFEEVRVPRFTLWSNVALGGFKLHHHILPYLLSVLGSTKQFPILKLWERLADPSLVTREVWDWIANGDGRPFALVVFYSGAHFPYAAPYPYYQEGTAAAYDGPSRYHKAAWVDADHAPGAEEQAQAVALYRGALRGTDAAIGTLLDRLDGAGLMAQTSIIVTADHGENLYESGFGIGHGDHLRGTVSSKIPLIVRPAAGKTAWKPHRVPNTVRSIDLGPTLASLVGARLDKADGTSLLPLIEGRERLSDPPVFFETGLWFINPEAEVLKNRTLPFMQGFGAFAVAPDTKEIFLDPSLDDDFLVAKHRAVYHDGWKLMYVPTREKVLWELYDTKKDPFEEKDVASTHPEQVERLKPMLREWILRDPALRPQGEWFVPAPELRR
ncbi:MAG: sulfatase-like hydrolase/transferase [Myxococcales bacterium]|nr:sulfatase-like hydrolase/transferase [Myxococcales bacterium]